MSLPLPQLSPEELQKRSENQEYDGEPFTNLKAENILGLKACDRNWSDLTGKSSDICIIQYQKDVRGNHSSHTWHSGLGISTNMDLVLEALQAGWTVRTYKFPEETRDTRLGAISNQCWVSPVHFGSWMQREVRRNKHGGATEYLLRAFEYDEEAQEKIGAAPEKYFDSKPSERLLSLSVADRFPGDQFSTYIDGDTWLIMYDTIVPGTTTDGYIVPRSGLGITTSKVFAKRVRSNPGWVMRVYKYTKEQRTAKWENIADHCASQPQSFGQWKMEPIGNDLPYIGTSSFLDNAADLADAAAKAKAERIASEKAAGKLPFDPITDRMRDE